MMKSPQLTIGVALVARKLLKCIADCGPHGLSMQLLQHAADAVYTRRDYNMAIRLLLVQRKIGISQDSARYFAI